MSTSEDQLLAALRERLYVAVVSDVLESMGYLDQAMSAELRPLKPHMRVIGRAHTLLATDVYERAEHPYDVEIDAVGALKPGDITFDGIVVFPQGILPQVVTRATEKVESENHTRDMLRDGALLREVYDRFGVL